MKHLIDAIIKQKVKEADYYDNSMTPEMHEMSGKIDAIIECIKISEKKKFNKKKKKKK